MLPFGWICSTDVTNTWTKMTVLFIIFPSLKHESLSISVSLSSVLPPKHFHSTVTIFKFYPSSQGVHSAYLLFPCLFLIFFLLMHCPPWNHHGNNPMQKKEKKKSAREKFPILFISVEFPRCPFSVLVDVFIQRQYCEQHQEDENLMGYSHRVFTRLTLV